MVVCMIYDISQTIPFKWHCACVVFRSMITVTNSDMKGLNAFLRIILNENLLFLNFLSHFVYLVIFICRFYISTRVVQGYSLDA